jgi:glutamate/tyrosine decarboxylase-like PLP-dependent enzyme
MHTDELAALRKRVSQPLPHPDLAAGRTDAAVALDWALQHFYSIPDQKVTGRASAAEMTELLTAPAPEVGRGFGEAFATYRERVVPYAFHIGSPRFLAFVGSAPTLPAVIGELLCAATNHFAGVWREGAGPTQVERIVLDLFKEWLGYPPDAAGLLTSGGSEANLTALVTARLSVPHDDRRRMVLYVSEERHGSVDRAAMIAGLHEGQVRSIAADDELRLSPAALGEMIHRDRAAGLIPWVVVANAGSTRTGTVDPLGELADLCAAERLWLHVDAAYGWSAMLTTEGKAALAGIERADSITLDPHKWFGQPFDAGCLLVRHGWQLPATFSQQPDYMQDVLAGSGEINFADYGLALTRRFRALKIWLSVQVLGVAWFRALIEHCLRLAEYAEAVLRTTPQFRIVNPRRLSLVCFRHEPSGLVGDEEALDRHNQALVDALVATGRAFLSSTRVRGRVALRMCFVNWRTTADDVDEILRLLTQLAEKTRRFGEA